MPYTRMRQVDIAKFLGMSRQAINIWTKEGCPRNEDGTYNSVHVIRWRMQKIKDECKASGGGANVDGDAWLSEGRKQTALMRKTQREKLEATLINRNEVSGGWAYRAAECAVGLSYLENRVPSRAEMKDRDTIKSLMRAETHALREKYFRDGRFCDIRIAEKVLEIMEREGFFQEIAEYAEDPEKYLEEHDEFEASMEEPEVEPEPVVEKPEKVEKPAKKARKTVKKTANKASEKGKKKAGRPKKGKK